MALWGYGGPAAGPQACYSACGDLWGGGLFFIPFRAPKLLRRHRVERPALCGQSEARVKDTIGQAEQELERITNRTEAAVYHQRWLAKTGALALMARNNPALAPYYRCLCREWRRRRTG